jgi:diguanylate cyclase (GGDEF)-like protein
MLLLGLFGPTPPVAVGFPAVVLLFTGYAVIWQCMRLFNGRPRSLLSLLGVVVAFAAVIAVVITQGATVGQRANLLSVALAMAAALSAYEVSRNRDAEFVGARLGMTALFGLMAISLSARALLSWLQPASATADAFYDPLHGASSLVNSVSVICLSIGLIMMAHERTSGRHRKLALTDELTGLPNRRLFLTQAERLARRAARNGKPACLLMMDLDHFAQVNERFGHAGGDEALALFAARLRRLVRSDDLVARYGGEEFCALLAGASRDEALAVAHEICAGLAARSITIQGKPHRLTVSIGVSEVRRNDIDAALQEADEALYRAKAAGRNRVAAIGRPAEGGKLDIATG